MAKIILLNGPPAAGKTTVSKLFIESQKPAEWAYIAHDDIRQLVRSGYKSADGLRSGWDEETKRQWRLGAENCVDLAVNFQQANISSIIDFYATKEEFSHWQKLLEGVYFAHIILLPTKDIVLARNNQRDFPMRLDDQKMIESYDEFEDWRRGANLIRIDNSAQTPKQTVDQLPHFLERH